LRNIILFTTVLFSILFIHAHADTPPARSINSQTYNGAGNTPITATTSGGKSGLDVNVINGGGSSTVNQGTPNGGGINSWWVQGSLGRSWSLLNSTDSVQSWLFDSTGLPLTSVGGSLNANVTNFPGAFGRTWTLNSGTDSVTITGSITATNSANGNTGSPVPAQATQAGGKDGSGNLRALSVDTTGDLNTNVLNFPSTFGVTQSTSPWVVSGTVATTQSTSPWVVSGTVAATQSGAWSTGRTWSLLNTTDSVNVGNFPATQAVTQSTSPWVVSGTVNVGNFPTTFGVTQSTSPWVVSGTVTSNIGTTNGLALDATLSAPQGSVSGGTAGTKSELAGGQYNTSAPTLTNGQQAALQLDSSGNLKTSGTTTIGGTVAVTQSTSPWVVGQSSGANLHANIDNFPAVQPVSQSGTWTTGRTWSLLNSTDSVNAVQSGAWNITNITGTVSLPTGAATSANQTTAIANQTNGTQKTQVVDGTGAVQGPAQAISGTNYMPVVLAASATNGSAVVSRTIQVAGSDGTNARTLSTDTTGKLNANISANVAPSDFTVNGNITTLCSTPTAACPAGSFVNLPIHGAASSRFYVTGSYVGLTIQVRCTLDGTNYNNLRFAGGTNGGYSSTAVAPVTATINTFRIFRFASCQSIQVYATAITSGTATIQLDVSGPPDLVENVNAGRTVIATSINNYATTNVTTSAYVTLVTLTASSITELNIFDSSGQTLYLSYATTCGGLVNTANTILVVPGGTGFIDWAIPSGVCIGIEAQSANATSGVFNATMLQ
jgi:hypothetical protein